MYVNSEVIVNIENTCMHVIKKYEMQFSSGERNKLYTWTSTCMDQPWLPLQFLQILYNDTNWQ